MGYLANTDPPPLKDGQVRCHACRNATCLTSSGHYRKHVDLFGMHCPTKHQLGVSYALTELPPVEHRGEAVTLALDPERVRLSDRKGSGNGVRRYGDCLDCGALVSGERKFCGMCAMRRDRRGRP